MRSILIFVFVLFLIRVSAQSDFERLNTLDGLSQNDINFIFQDSKGFMWFGTVDGLNRYDGMSFVTYRRNSVMDYPIGSNLPFCMVEDSTGNFWIGTSDDGIWYFDRKREAFHQFPFERNGKELLTEPQIGAIHLDAHGKLWVATRNSLSIIDTYKYREGEYDVEVIYEATPYSNVYPVGSLSNIGFIKSGKDGQIWFGSGMGLFKASVSDRGGCVINRVVAAPREACKGIEETQNGYVASFFSGLYYLKRDSDDLNKIISSQFVSDMYFNAFTRTRDGFFWGGNPQGLYQAYFDEKNTELRLINHYKHEFTNSKSLSKSNVVDIYEDRYGLLWVGTNGGGLNKLDLNKKKFKHVYQTMEQGSLSYNKIRALFEDKSHNLWVGTEGGGISFLPKMQRNNYTNGFKHLAVSSSQSGQNSVYCFAEIPGEDNKLLVGTGYPMKLGMANITGNGNIDIVSYDNLVTNSVFSTLTDSKGNIWLGTYRGGLYKTRYNVVTGVLESIRHFKAGQRNNSGLSSDVVRSIMEDKEGNLFIGTDNGLNVLPSNQSDKDHPVFELFKYEALNDSSLAHNYVLDMFQDSQNNIWIGTMGGGLCLLNRTSGGKVWFKRYSTKNGFPNDVIKGIEEDADGNLWISSNGGLTRFNSTSKEIRNYVVADGLQDFEFSELASCKSNSGELFFGGVNGFNVFDPSQIKDNLFGSHVEFTAFYVLNDLIIPGEKYNGRTLIQYEMPFTKEVKLKFAENSFSVAFSALNFAAPKKIQYKYKLEGFDMDWVTLIGNESRASYTNVPPGEYELKVLATNNDGIWNAVPSSLNITIYPPLWRTNYAIVFYALLIVLLLIFFRRYSIIAVTHKNQLEMEHFEKEKMAELVQMKLQFFTNISHEFRTPLTLIQSPLEKLIARSDQVDENYRQRHYSLIMKNIGILNRLINQLMEFRRLERGKMPLAVTKGDLGELIKESFELFGEIAQTKDIRFMLKNEHPFIELWFDRDKIEKVLFNLLSNALKYTPQGGEVILKVSEVIVDRGEYVKIDVIDNGPGIDEDKMPFMFDRFFQAGSHRLSKVSGTGIGLSFAKNLVLLHHGKISVSSAPNKETVFTVLLRKGKLHFSEGDFAKQAESQGLEKEVKVKEYSVDKPIKNEIKPATFDKDKPLVLIVEDSFDVQEYLYETLLEGGFNCIQGYNGREGLELCREYLPDLVISDVMMPEMDGFELCNQIKLDELICHIPVVLLTAKTTDPDQITGLSSGAEAYIPKPFNTDVLIAQVKSILEARRLVKKKFAQKLDVEPGEVTFTSMDEKLIARLLRVVENNMDNPEFSVAHLAGEVGMSQSILNKKLKALLGQTANAFIRTIRLKRAAQLLKLDRHSVTDVVYEVGFSDMKYFRECFRKQFDTTPTDYVRQYRDDKTTDTGNE